MIRRALAAATVTAAAVAAGAPPAPALDVARVEDRILDPSAHGRITYENTVNVASYQQEAILTHRGYQYTAWYQNDGPGPGQATAVIARRALPDGAWESTRIGYTLWSNDSHNTIALGVTPTDGRLHVAFPTHDGPVRYTRTVPGVARPPRARRLVVAAVRRGLQPRSRAPRSTHPTFTYPQFENVGDEALLTWRSGSTDNGRQALLRYNDDRRGHVDVPRPLHPQRGRHVQRRVRDQQQPLRLHPRLQRRSRRGAARCHHVLARAGRRMVRGTGRGRQSRPRLRRLGRRRADLAQQRR